MVDASVAIKLFVQEPDSGKAGLLFARLTDPEPIQLFAPQLLYVECANTLWKYCQFFNYSESIAEQNLLDLRDLRLHIVPDKDLFAEAFKLALKYEITVYDAVYLQLARLAACNLVTADEKLARKLDKSVAYLVSLRQLKLA